MNYSFTILPSNFLLFLSTTPTHPSTQVNTFTTNNSTRSLAYLSINICFSSQLPKYLPVYPPSSLVVHRPTSSKLCPCMFGIYTLPGSWCSRVVQARAMFSFACGWHSAECTSRDGSLWTIASTRFLEHPFLLFSADGFAAHHGFVSEQVFFSFFFLFCSVRKKLITI